MVMTVSNILLKDASLDEEGGGSTAAVGSTYSSAMGSPEKGGGGFQGRKIKREETKRKAEIFDNRDSRTAEER